MEDSEDGSALLNNTVNLVEKTLHYNSPLFRRLFQELLQRKLVARILYDRRITLTTTDVSF